MCGNIRPNQQPVPCISGGPDNTTAELASTICLAAAPNCEASSNGETNHGWKSAHEELGKAIQRIHHALGHTGGAAGIQQDLIALGLGLRGARSLREKCVIRMPLAGPIEPAGPSSTQIMALSIGVDRRRALPGRRASCERLAPRYRRFPGSGALRRGSGS